MECLSVTLGDEKVDYFFFYRLSEKNNVKFSPPQKNNNRKGKNILTEHKYKEIGTVYRISFTLSKEKKKKGKENACYYTGSKTIFLAVSEGEVSRQRNFLQCQEKNTAFFLT